MKGGRREEGKERGGKTENRKMEVVERRKQEDHMRKKTYETRSKKTSKTGFRCTAPAITAYLLRTNYYLPLQSITPSREGAKQRLRDRVEGHPGIVRGKKGNTDTERMGVRHHNSARSTVEKLGERAFVYRTKRDG